MIVRDLPTTCFGEDLRTGTLRIAEYCMVESLCLLVFFTLCAVSDLTNIWGAPAFYDFIPVCLFIVSLVKVIANVFLYQGVTKGNVEYLRFWLCVYGVNTALMLLFMVATGITMSVLFHPRVNAYVTGAQCMLFMLYCGMFKYFCQVVYAYKLKVEAGRDSMLRPIVIEQNENHGY